MFESLLKVLIYNIRLWCLKGQSLAVLGMKGAGKTQFYNTLREKYEDSTTGGTGVEYYNSFLFAYGDRKIKVKKGKDIGGGEAYISEHYKDMIAENDIIIFVFDASRYLYDEEYAFAVKVRMDSIWVNLEKKYKDDIKSHLVTLGTHLDCIKESNNLYPIFHESVMGKEYAPMFHNNFILCNLRNREKFMNQLIDNKIFG